MKYYLLLLLTVLLLACSSPPPNDAPLEVLYIGTFSVRNSEGLYAYQFDRRNKNFQLIETVAGPDSPSFLDISTDGKYLYTANRQSIGPDSTSGSVVAYEIDPASGKLRLINQSSSYGVSPCHVSLNERGDQLFLSHYAGGSITVLSILDNGSIGPLFDTIQHRGHSQHPERQQAPHLHSIQSIPGSHLFLAADLGTDKLYFYEYGADSVQIASIAPIEVQAGAGPRHFIFSNDYSYLYLAEELSSTVSTFQLDIPNKEVRFIQRLSTLPPDFAGQNTVADIHLSPDGRFLYVSNRGHDSLAIYEVDPNSGQLRFIAHQSTLGRTPRNFMIDPQGTFLLVANQDSDECILFDRTPSTGLLRATDRRMAVPSPVCLKWWIAEP